MGLNDTQSSMRPHISFFGVRNAGKSSLVNAVTGQSLAIVSDKLGTTTDPVQKAMELLPLGPVVIIDTPGIDDEGELGSMRVQRAKRVLNKTDIAVLVVDVAKGMSKADEELTRIFEEKGIPYVVAYNKTDTLESAAQAAPDLIRPAQSENALTAVRPSSRGGYGGLSPRHLCVSAKTGLGIDALKEKLAALGKNIFKDKLLIGDKLQKDDIVILVIPIDEAAPKGRIILPQQNVLRECLDAGASAICVQPAQLSGILQNLMKKPRLVITDSQVFSEVAEIVPDDIVLTSFSILLANYKGYLSPALKGVDAIQRLSDGSVILIAEGCTHHRQCSDIGTVKLPRILRKLTGKELIFETSSGVEFPEDLSKYSLVVHCGGCMVNDREMLYRIKCAADQGVPVINYGILFAHAGGILKRSLEILN